MEDIKRLALPRISLILLVTLLEGAVAVRHHTRHTSGLTDSVAGLLSDGTALTDLPYSGAASSGAIPLFISVSWANVVCAQFLCLTMLIGDYFSP